MKDSRNAKANIKVISKSTDKKQQRMSRRKMLEPIQVASKLLTLNKALESEPKDVPDTFV